MRVVGWLVMICGAVLIAAGLSRLIGNRMKRLGDIPGDICIQGRHFSYSIPLVICVVSSILLTVILSVVFRLLQR